MSKLDEILSTTTINQQKELVKIFRDSFLPRLCSWYTDEKEQEFFDRYTQRFDANYNFLKDMSEYVSNKKNLAYLYNHLSSKKK